MENSESISHKIKNVTLNMNPRISLFLGLMFLYILKSFLFKLYTVDILKKAYSTNLIFEIITIGCVLLIISSFTKKKTYLISLYVFTLLTIIMYVGNLIYAENFGDLIGVLAAFQADQIGNVSYVIIEDFTWEYLIFLIDIPLIFIINRKWSLDKSLVKNKYIIIVISIIVLAINLTLAGVTSKITMRSWNAKVAMDVGLFTYHLTEIPTTLYKMYFPEPVQTKDEEILAEKKEIKTVDTDTKGLLANKNVVFIQWETLSKYGLLMNVDGKDVMPNLKSIYEKSFANEKFLNTVATGHSSDTEFLTLQSMYNYNDKAVSVMDSGKELKSFVHLLKENDYYTFSMHNFAGRFWNRKNMHNTFGFNESYFLEDELDKEEGRLMWGYSDKILYQEAHKKINEVYKDNGKFMSYLITVQNHTPFEIENPEKYHIEYESKVKNKDTNSYFTSLHETDAYFGEFMESIQNEEWYKDTVFVIYADHDLELESDALFDLLNQEEYTYADKIKHELTPFMIYSPTIDLSKYNESYGNLDMSHLDVAPSLSQLFDLNTKGYPFFGQNIFDNSQKHFTYHVQNIFLYEDYIYVVDSYPDISGYKKIHRETGVTATLTKEEISFINEKIDEKEASQRILNNNSLVNTKSN